MGKYLEDTPLQEVLANPELFEKVLDRVVSVAIERALINLPKLILTQVQSAETMRKIVEEFYLDNRDLRQYKNLVGATITRLHAANPGMPTKDLLALAASDVRNVVKNTK